MNVLSIPSTYGLCQPISGGQSRFRHLVEELTKRGHRFVVLESNVFADRGDEKLANVEYFRDLELGDHKLSGLRDFSPSFFCRLIEMSRNRSINLIDVTHPGGSVLVSTVMRLRRGRLPLVYNSHNVEYILSQEIEKAKKDRPSSTRLLLSRYTKWTELILCKVLADHIIAVSEEDREFFIKVFGVSPERVTVVPSGCAILERTPASKAQARKRLGIDMDAFVAVFHGSYFHPPNAAAARIIQDYIAPEIARRDERALFLVGGTDSPRFEKRNIRFLGPISDLPEFLNAADIGIVPLSFGAGTKLKLLDYLGAGLPVVTTRKGAEGIGIRNHRDALIVERVDKTFVDSIEFLQRNEGERMRIGANAAIYARARHSWASISKELEATYRRVTEARAGAHRHRRGDGLDEAGGPAIAPK